jgi:pseudouridine-5'-phosphate glycosidase
MHAPTNPLLSRVIQPAVALETTLLLHGVPKSQSLPLAAELAGIVREAGAHPALVGVLAGTPTVGMTEGELRILLDADNVPKVNTASLGVALHRNGHAATTVSTTMELAAAAGVRVFATGGLGGVHKGFGTSLDISADLAAFTRFPVAVVCSGVKSLLDVEATREALESLGVPVVGYRTNRFPAFYLKASTAGVDAMFDDAADLARFASAEMARTGRGVVVCNPIPDADEISRTDWDRWYGEASRLAAGAAGRDVTPTILGHLHRVSGGATLRANLALIHSNTRLAAQLAVAMASEQPPH